MFTFLIIFVHVKVHLELKDRLLDVKLSVFLRKSAYVPLEQVGVEGEEAVQGVGVGGHTVTPCRAADHWQQVAMVPLYDGVTEHHLVLPATETYQSQKDCDIISRKYNV